MKRPLRPIVGLALLACLGSCSDGPMQPCSSCPPLPPHPNELVVSNPVNPSAPVRAPLPMAGGQRTTGAVVYVSLPPGTIPGGGLVTIRNPRTGDSVRAAMAAGGFDPVPIAAAANDTLVASVEFGGSRDSTFILVVPVRSRPIVVRTDPPPRKRDVPLNSHMVIVFSEPIQPSTAASIRVSVAGAPVSGNLAVAPEGLRAEFTPAVPLAPNTTYLLSVPTDVMDLGGDALEQAVDVEFTTGTTAAVAMVSADPSAVYVVSGYPRLNGRLRTFDFSAVLQDDGHVSGSYNLFYRETGWGNSGRITCFSIKSDTAWVAGVIEASASNPETIGEEIGWLVVDNGPAGNGAADQLSLAMVSLAAGGFGTARDFCDFQSTLVTAGPEAGQELPRQDVESGDLLVTGIAPPITRGALRVTTQTVGALDPDGYGLSVCREGTDCRQAWDVPVNDAVTLARLLPGSYTVELVGVGEPGDCSVAGANPRTLDISPNETAQVAFVASCPFELLVPYGSSGYRFKVWTDSTRAQIGFELPGFDDVAAGFSDGSGAFGTQDSDNFEDCPLFGTDKTFWPTQTDLLLRKTFDLPSGSDRVTVRVAIDDDVQVFVNGVDVTSSGIPNFFGGGFQRHGGCAERESFVFPVPDAILRVGSNLLAIRARDHGVISYADLRVTAGRE